MRTRFHLAIATLALAAFSAALSAAEHRLGPADVPLNDAIARLPLAPGDVITLEPGRYHDTLNLDLIPADAAHPTTVRAAQPGLTVFDGAVRPAFAARAPGSRFVWWAPVAENVLRVYEKDTDTEYTRLPSIDQLEDNAGSYCYDAGLGRLYVHASDSAQWSLGHHVIDACVIEDALATQNQNDHTPRVPGLVIDGIVVANYARYGIWINTASHCAVRNCVVHHTGRGIGMRGAFASVIENCEAFANADAYFQEAGNISFFGVSIHCRISGCTSHTTSQHGLRFYGGWYGCRMENNFVHDCGVGIQNKGTAYVYDAPNSGVDALGYAGNWGHAAEVDPQAIMHTTGNVVSRCNAGLLAKDAGDGGDVQGNSVRASWTFGAQLVDADVSAAANVVAKMDADTDGGNIRPSFADPAWHDLRLQSDSTLWNDVNRTFPAAGAHEVLYASPQGVAGADGRSAASPLPPAQALASLRDGQTLYLLPGVYPQSFKLYKRSNVTLRAYGRGERGRVELRGGLEIWYGRGIAIEGLYFRGSALPAMSGSFATRANACIRVIKSQDVRIRENVVLSAPVNGIYVSYSSSQIEVRNNILAFCENAGINLDQRYPGSRGVELANNVWYANAVHIEAPEGLGVEFRSDYNAFGKGYVACVKGKYLKSLTDWRRIHGADGNGLVCDCWAEFVDLDDWVLRTDSALRGRGEFDRHIGIGRVAPVDLQFLDIEVVYRSETQANLRWRSVGRASTLVVEWGVRQGAQNQPALGRVTIDDQNSFDSVHACTIEGLDPARSYWFRVGDAGHRDVFGKYPFIAWTFSTQEDARLEAWLAEPVAGRPFSRLETQPILSPALLVPAFNPQNRAQPRELHVDAAAAFGGDGSAQTPFRTIREANFSVRPGDRVIVHQGVYEETIRPLCSGEQGAPIVYEAAAGERVVLSGLAQTLGSGATLRACGFVTLRGFWFQEHVKFARSAGRNIALDLGAAGQVHLSHAHDIIVEGCSFDGRQNYCYSVWGRKTRNVTLRDNLFDNHWTSASLADHTGDAVVDHNTFVGQPIYQLQIRCYSSDHDIRIRNNVFGEKAHVKYVHPKVYVRGVHLEMDRNLYLFDRTNEYRYVLRFDVLRTCAGGNVLRDGRGGLLFDLRQVQVADWSDDRRVSWRDWRNLHGQDVHSRVFVGSEEGTGRPDANDPVAAPLDDPWGGALLQLSANRPLDGVRQWNRFQRFIELTENELPPALFDANSNPVRDNDGIVKSVKIRGFDAGANDWAAASWLAAPNWESSWTRLFANPANLYNLRARYPAFPTAAAEHRPGDPNEVFLKAFSRRAVRWANAPQHPAVGAGDNGSDIGASANR